jgi:formate dehydrogenase subunit delta
MDTSNNLVRMANDIGNFFRTQPRREDAIAGIRNHILSFWTRTMREKLLAQAAHGEIGLEALPLEAVRRLAETSAVKPNQASGGDAG